MDFDTVVKKRRSIRSYTEREVPDSLIRTLLAYGHAAPSGGNLHPWEFIVVRDPGMKRRIVDTTYRGNDFDGTAHQAWLMEAPVFIVVVADKPKSAARYGEKAVQSLIYLDCSACIENMLLGAVHLGLASCYISGFREPELNAVLDLPEGFEVIAVLPIGYSEDEGRERPKTPLDEIVHQESYSR